MGQALRRAMERGRSSSLKATPPAYVKNVERRPRVVPADLEILKKSEDETRVSDSERASRTNPENNVLEERDPGYDAMLSQMVGRIRSKPGGKLEMGEASIVESYNRPLPKLRDSMAVGAHDEQKIAPPGTLNVAQLREIFLLQQGKSNEHNGPMDVHQIAEKLRVDVEHVQKILKFLTLPPEDDSKKTGKNNI